MTKQADVDKLMLELDGTENKCNVYPLNQLNNKLKFNIFFYLEIIVQSVMQMLLFELNLMLYTHEVIFKCALQKNLE